MVPRILIFEPDTTDRNAYRCAFEKKHFWVVSSSDSQEAKQLMEKQHFHLCLWALEPPFSKETINELKAIRPQTAIIATHLNPTTEQVVQCIRGGASHFFEKNSSIDTLLQITEDTLSRFITSQEQAPQNIEEQCGQMVGNHPTIQRIYKLITQIKDTDSTVLITGESGTGKELVAHAIHTLSKRMHKPWVAINCSAIPANLLESELFGHVKGAFTGATQNRVGRFKMVGSGTLFLDEIGDLPLDLQAKILRAIQNRTFEPVGSAQSIPLDARIIAATNHDLEQAVVERRFREDLFYRLNVIPITLPPLRHRRSDIPHLVRAFMDRFGKLNNRKLSGISEEALQCLMQYHWPGNVRELENLIERVVVLKEGDGVIEQKDFPIGYFKNVRLDRFVANVELPEDGLSFNEAVNEFENELILQALRKTEGNKNQAAHLLKLNRTTLVEKLKRKGLQITS